MKYGIIAEGQRIVGVISDGIPTADNCIVVESDLVPNIILSECIIVNGNIMHVGEPPSPYMEYSIADNSWQDNRSLEQRKQALLNTLYTYKDEAVLAPIQYNGLIFSANLSSDPLFQGILSAAKAASATGYTFSKEYVLANNAIVTLQSEDFIGIEMAKLWQVDAAFQEYRLKKAAIEAATTLEELEALTI